MEAARAVLSSSSAWLLLGGGYLAGSIPFGLILALLVGKKDVRLAGSGNIGATNVARVVGKKLGIVTLVLDAAKGAVPVVIAGQVLFADAAPVERVFAEGAVGLCALLGHCFPIWLKLKGGKGVATGLGVMLAHRPEVAAVGLVVFGVAYGVFRLVSVGSLAAAVGVVVALAVLGPRDVSLVPLALCVVVIVARHHGNLRRILKRAELKV
ncbi:MAG: glycerol-3-phosphate 1-O-acyltransferase PlsY [Deltaproteobacteria bacterium]|nr:glycerol-3-phosphate 1-O-acyltransferase PlsY [Deltaproteobacteria bacterium]